MMPLLPLHLPLAAANMMEHVQDKRLSATPLFHLFNRPIYFTSHMVMILIAALLMLLIFPMMGAQSRKNPVPSGIRNFFEAILSYLRTEVFIPALGENTDRFAPYLWTTFFFILFCNLLGLVPLHEVILLINAKAGSHIPEIGGTATGNIAVTIALAVIAFITFHVSGLIQAVRIEMDPSLAPHHTGPDHTPFHGHGGSFGAEGQENADVKIDHHVGDGHNHAHGVHYAHGPRAVAQGKPFPVALVTGTLHYIKNFVPQVPIWLWPAMFVLEIIGALVKPFSLCMRLFANMIAGHLVLASFLTLIFLVTSYVARGGISVPIVIACAVFSVLEVFVAFLQAYIFTFLTALFIASAVAPEH
ncbi:MAG TPA: F0F1 ATP synthase subunit A [Phycisphaerae bacterium]|nr:F0F1 ATP synthase subunit A [Phycisphaerae bacterium]